MKYIEDIPDYLCPFGPLSFITFAHYLGVLSLLFSWSSCVGIGIPDRGIHHQIWIRIVCVLVEVGNRGCIQICAGIWVKEGRGWREGVFGNPIPMIIKDNIRWGWVDRSRGMKRRREGGKRKIGLRSDSLCGCVGKGSYGGSWRISRRSYKLIWSRNEPAKTGYRSGHWRSTNNRPSNNLKSAEEMKQRNSKSPLCWKIQNKNFWYRTLWVGFDLYCVFFYITLFIVTTIWICFPLCSPMKSIQRQSYKAVLIRYISTLLILVVIVRKIVSISIPSFFFIFIFFLIILYLNSSFWRVDILGWLLL